MADSQLSLTPRGLYTHLPVKIVIYTACVYSAGRGAYIQCVILQRELVGRFWPHGLSRGGGVADGPGPNLRL